jgi:hypothetical protein
MCELTRDYAVETVDTSSLFPRIPPLGCGARAPGQQHASGPTMMREAQLTARRHRPVAEMWIAERSGRGLIGVADLGRRQ